MEFFFFLLAVCFQLLNCLLLLLDKLREHILRIHAKNSPTKNTKRSKTNIKEESSEKLREDESIDYNHNDEDIYSTEETVCPAYSETKSIQSEDELPDVDLKEASSKPRFKPKVPPTDYERFIYKCQYCMLGFKRRGKVSTIFLKTFTVL